MIEKILEMLEAREKHHKNMANSKTGVLSEIDKVSHIHFAECFKEAKAIVQEVAKDGGWIPCSERLPEHMQQCITTARIYFIPDHVDEPNNYIGVELNTYSKNLGWLGNSNVIAWQPLPAPYQKGE